MWMLNIYVYVNNVTNSSHTARYYINKWQAWSEDLTMNIIFNICNRPSVKSNAVWHDAYN